MTTKAASVLMAILVASIAIINFVHVKVILPAVLAETRMQTREMISNHGRNVHVGAVSEREFQMIVDEIRSLKMECNRRLDNINEKLSR